MSSHIINGLAGKLEALLEQPDSVDPNTPVAIVCHPHTLYGGTMQNKVVHTIAKACLKLGMPVLRFNFRGAGNSEGHFEHGLGEQADLNTVVEWVQSKYPSHPIWLAGFSFGSFVAYKSFHQVNAERLLLVAPPVGLFEFQSEINIDIPWTVIQGKDDEITPPDSVEAWVKSHAIPPDFYYLDDVSHFFHGKLNLLRGIVLDIWGK